MVLKLASRSAPSGARARLVPAALLTLVLACLLAPAAAAQAPPNDAFAQAAPLSGVPSVVRGSLAEATPEAGEPSHSPSARTTRSVWYRLTPSETVPVLANTCDADFDSVVAVYTGPSLDRLSFVAAGDDECAETGSEVACLAEAGTTYHLVVASFARPAGPGFTLQLERAPLSPNDAFADAGSCGAPGASEARTSWRPGSSASPSTSTRGTCTPCGSATSRCATSA